MIRTFGHDHVEYSELISATLIANFALGYGLGSQAGGALVDSAGFRATSLGVGVMTVVIPLFLVGVLQRPCLGRDLAPMSADDADAGSAAAIAARAKEAGARDTPQRAAMVEEGPRLPQQDQNQKSEP